jgi:hypothetical protein
MAKKKVFALRMDEEIYAAIERWATDEFRSTNGQLEWIISKALKDARRFPPTSMDETDAGIVI